MSIKLKQSPVTFQEECHRYYLGEKRLVGITGLIHEVLQLGVYPDANEFVRNTAIPRAAEYGSAVHKSIEMYDEIGIKQTVYPNSFGDDPWDVSLELESYIKHRKGFVPVANEYTVSDCEQWASNIDNVWQRESTGGIWLVDTKTNNLNYYPLDGYGQPNFFPDHAAGLKEYLSWQLSVYAELFEAQNPGYTVEGLAANWLRKGDAAFWVIERKPSKLVKELLKAVWFEDADGHVVYTHHAPAILHPNLGLPVATANATPLLLPEDAIKFIYDNLKAAKEAEEQLKKMKTLLREAMERHGIKSWDSGLFKSTIAADCEKETFDTKRFKADHPELAVQYITRKPQKGSFTIKLKDND